MFLPSQFLSSTLLKLVICYDHCRGMMYRRSVSSICVCSNIQSHNRKVQVRYDAMGETVLKSMIYSMRFSNLNDRILLIALHNYTCFDYPPFLNDIAVGIENLPPSNWIHDWTNTSSLVENDGI